MGYVYISVATLGIAGNFLLQKFYQKRFCKTSQAVLLFPLITSFLNFFFYFAMNGFAIRYGGYTVGMSVLYALATAYDTIVGLIIMKYCSMSFFSMFIMMGGMFLPFLYGAVFLDEEVTVFRIIAIILLIIALILISINRGKDKISTKGFLLCVSVFIMNGLVSTIAKAHQINSAALSSTDFTVWVMIFTVVLTSALNLFVYFKSKREKSIDTQTEVKTQNDVKKGVFIKIILYAVITVITCISTICQLNGAKIVDAGMLYPMTTGGSIVLMTVFGAVLYKEKLNLKIVSGVIIAVVATVLFAF